MSNGSTAHIPARPTEAEYQALVEEFWWGTTYVAKSLWRDDLVDFVADLFITLERNHTGKATTFGDFDRRVGLTSVFNGDVFDEEKNEDIILVLRGSIPPRSSSQLFQSELYSSLFLIAIEDFLQQLGCVVCGTEQKFPGVFLGILVVTERQIISNWKWRHWNGMEVSMKSVPLGSQDNVEFTASLSFSQHNQV